MDGPQEATTKNLLLVAAFLIEDPVTQEDEVRAVDRSSFESFVQSVVITILYLLPSMVGRNWPLAS